MRNTALSMLIALAYSAAFAGDLSSFVRGAARGGDQVMTDRIRMQQMLEFERERMRQQHALDMQQLRMLIKSQNEPAVRESRATQGEDGAAKFIVELGGYCNVSDDCVVGLYCIGNSCVKP